MKFEIPAPDASISDAVMTIKLDEYTLDDDWVANWNTNTNGYGRACLSDGTTEIATDWVGANNVAETGTVYVHLDETWSDGDSEIWLWPLNSGRDQYAASDTYGQEAVYPTDLEIFAPLGDTDDRTSNDLDGTATGASSTSSGQVGGAYSFDGDNDEIDFGTSPAGGLSAITVLAWVKPDNDSATQMLIEDGTAYNTNAFYVYMTSGKLQCSIMRGGHDSATDNGTKLSASAYNHIGFSWTSDERIKLIRDGAILTDVYQAGSLRRGTLAVGNTNLTLGGRPTDPMTLDYEGDIDEFCIFSSVLSAAEIEEIYEQGADSGSYYTVSYVAPAASGDDGFLMTQPGRFGHADL